MKRIFRNALALAISLLLISAPGLSEMIKDEVVYARLSLLGEVESVYVVNSFEAQEQARGQDYGAYLEVTPLSQAEVFSYQEDKADFAMGPGRFYYQGIPENKALPWEISLRYALNGQEAAPEALSGAKGQLEIFFEILPLETGKAYHQSLSMTATFTLPGARVLDVQAPEATLAYAGGDITLSYVILPGQGASYVISAQVEDFAMAGAQFAAVRMGVDMAMYQGVAAQTLEGTPFGTLATGVMEQFLSGMQGQPLGSFTDARNQVRSLQFVFLTEEVPVLRPQAAPKAPQEEAQETVWQRLLGLFGG